MLYRLAALAFLVLLSCNGSDSNSELPKTINFLDITTVNAPEGMELFDERTGRSPYQIYFSENKELELQFKLLNNFAGDMPRLQGIYDRNAQKNEIQILESQFVQINDRGFLLHRTEGVNDDINYHSLQLLTILNDKIVQCMIRTPKKYKEKWLETMNAMAETIQMQ